MPPSIRDDFRRLSRRPALAVWCLLVFLTPFYVFHNGLPQPGDVLIIPLVPMAMAGWNGRLRTGFARVLRPFARFMFWVILVDLVWAVILWNWGIDQLFPTYYIFDGAIMFVGFILFERYGEAMIRLTVHVVLVDVMIQIVASVILGGGRSRNMLFFTNPNQLGYYALLAACIIALCQRRVGFGIWTAGIALTACAYLALFSSSRSAAAGIVVLFGLLVFANPRVLVIATILAGLLLLIGGPVTDATDALQARVNQPRNADLTFFEQRGYDRIWANKQYTVLGAGEGAGARFADTTIMGSGEIHSSAGTLLFCYGFVGVGLFIAFLLPLVRGASFRAALILLPPLEYTFAHQGLRFTMLWVLLSLFPILKIAQAPAKSTSVALPPAS
jgi:hypothetical protein